MARVSWLTALILAAANWIWAQPNPTQRWAVNFGGDTTQIGRQILQTSDGRYVIVGTTERGQDSSADIYLVKIDSLGNNVWTRTIGTARRDVARAFRQTTDGGFILAGTTETATNDFATILMKTGNTGSQQWSRTYTAATWEGGNDIELTPDGGYIITGVTDAEDAPRPMLRKTDGSGNPQWTRYQTYSSDVNDGGRAVVCTPDGEYAALSTTVYHGGDGLLWKANAQGNTRWSHAYGGTQAEELNAMAVTLDGGLVLAGISESFGIHREIYILRCDSTGTVRRTIHHGPLYDYEIHDVMQMGNGDFVVCGSRSTGNTDGLLARFDSTGQFLWERTYGGGNGAEVFYSVQRTRDACYIMTGTTTTAPARGVDVYVVKSGPDPIELAAETYQPPLPDTYSLAVYPNPFNANATVEFVLPRPEHAVLALFDITGREVRLLADAQFSAGSHRVRVDGGSLPTGIYFVRLTTEHHIATHKLLLLR